MLMERKIQLMANDHDLQFSLWVTEKQNLNSSELNIAFFLHLSAVRAVHVNRLSVSHIVHHELWLFLTTLFCTHHD